MKHGCWIHLMWWKLFFPQFLYQTVFVLSSLILNMEKSIVLLCQSGQSFCTYTVHLCKHYIAPSFLCVLSVQICVELPNYFSSCYYTHAFCACLCFCSALHRCSKIDFLRLSHHTVRAGSRKCLLPWRSVNVMFWQTLPSDTWQRALLLSGPPCECADARAWVCASFPASLMRRFLRLFVFSQTMTLRRGLMGDKLQRPRRAHKALFSLTRSSSWDPLRTSTSWNIIQASDNY